MQYRVSGPDISTVRKVALDLASIVGANPHLSEPAFDWNEPSRVVRVGVMQDKARQFGVTSEDIALTLNGVVGGTTITQVRDSIYLVDVVGRAIADERGSIETLKNLQLNGQNGRSIPLATVASFSYDLEQPIVWRRSRIPTITIKAAVLDATQPATVVAQLTPAVEVFRAKLPRGYAVAMGGSVEESAKSSGADYCGCTADAGAPLGFVALLGVLALIGILIRNSVILVVQIEDLRREGRPPWVAVVEATEHGMRPILLTAAAATLALIPISREIFLGPMAYAMMGGIVVGTVLTLLFIPALYVAWFRIKPPAAETESLLRRTRPP